MKATPFFQPKATIIEDSVAQNGKRLTTYCLSYQRFIHAEFMTHRVFSRNAASSRAIPVAKMIEQVRVNPAMPAHWGKNQAGMQAREEHSAPVLLNEAVEFDNPSDMPLFEFRHQAMTPQEAWVVAANNAADVAQAMTDAGYHKQVVNRILEPFQIMHVIASMTEDENFFELRDHPDAEPNIQLLARAMKVAKAASTPHYRAPNDCDKARGWHLPYVTAEERELHAAEPLLLAKLSAARCARVSYLNHDGSTPDVEKDLALYERLVGSRPLHASPVEHQAHAAWSSHERSRNFRGWMQFRELVEADHATASIA